MQQAFNCPKRKCSKITKKNAANVGGTAEFLQPFGCTTNFTHHVTNEDQREDNPAPKGEKRGVKHASRRMR